jgi:prepilin-type N-terminal cleavage/methylation domain-containing protein
MKMKFKHNGFSLTEVLFAVGILTVGLLLIATMFPVGIYLTAVASERTMAAVVADEAFAKIQLYGLKDSHNGDPNNCYDYETDGPPSSGIDPGEFSYPSVDPNGSSQYYWSAVYRKTQDNTANGEYQITVFVARKTNPGLTYPGSPADRPTPFQISSVDVNNLQVSQAKYISPPTAIIDNANGQLYRVVKKEENIANKIVITFDRPWQGGNSATIWLIPPPQSGGKNAGVEVYQRIMKF